MPRLSVDIDLTFLQIAQREISITQIETGLRSLAQEITKRNKRYQVRELKTQAGMLHKLLVTDGLINIKIEPNFIMRGTLLPIKKMDLKKSIEDRFEYSVKNIPVLAEEELYAGKMCAALSRQHPRDFFDIKKLLEDKGITENIRQAFVIYLVCSPRPIHELLNPNLVILKEVYEHEFVNMTEEIVALDELLAARELLIKTISDELTDNERKFLLSIKTGQPDYSLMPFDNLEYLPALKWKLINIQKMDKTKHSKMLDKLKSVLRM